MSSSQPARVRKPVVRPDQEVGHWARPGAGLHAPQFGQSADQLGAGLLLAVLHQWAEHREECRQVLGEQPDQLLQQVQQEHVVCEEWVQC